MFRKAARGYMDILEKAERGDEISGSYSQVPATVKHQKRDQETIGQGQDTQRPAKIEIPQRNAPFGFVFLEQQGGNYKATDHEEDSHTE
jgi:hypothetical protein